MRFLEDAYFVLTDYEIEGFATSYSRAVAGVLQKFNLRYRVDQPFTLRFLLPGSFANLYEELHRLSHDSTHLFGLLADFEKAFDRYVQTQDDTDLKTCIGKASNYAEGIASHTCGEHLTLGALADQLSDWPHDEVRDALKSIYKFCSDYPGIRHWGNPEGVHRELAIRDVTLASLLLLSFSGYLSPLLDERVVLGV